MSANNNREDTVGLEMAALRLELENWRRSEAKTLRDEFAMAALVNCSDHMGCPKEMAEAAYEIADAMFEARKAKR